MINEWCLNPLENKFKKSDVGQSFINLTYLFCIRYLVYSILIGGLIPPKVKTNYLGGGTKNETILNPYNTAGTNVRGSLF